MTIVAVLLGALLLAAVIAAIALRDRVARLQGEVDAAADALAEAGIESGAIARGIDELAGERDEAVSEAGVLRTAVDGTTLGMVITDRKGDVVFANQAAAKVLRGRGGDAVSRSRLFELISRVIASGEAQTFDFDLYSPVRRSMRLRAVALPAGPPGRAEGGAVAYLRDLTEQHRIEAIRRDFVANAGHELKTPLGALTVLAETLAEADDPETRQRLSARLEEEATRMARVVEDILELATIESMELPPEPVVIADVLSEAGETVAIEANDAGITLVAKLPPPEVQVSGNREQLVSAVVNLLTNAVKYSAGSQGATVWYRAWREGPWVHVEVEDHGIGISREHQERIFERFYRVDRGRSRASGGTGLGLSIVRNVARVHGGEATVRSQPAEGSTFTIKLPVLEE